MACNGRHDSSSLPEPSFQICIVGDSLKQNEALTAAIGHFGLPVVYSSSGIEFMDQGGEYTTIYVLEEFEGESYKSLHKSGQRILGPTTVIQYAEKNEPLPNNIRPLYTISMKNLAISFSGFRVKEELSSMVALIHHMGGSIRKDFNISKTTHLVATPSSTSGEKYRYAASLGIPIMTSQWIYETWSRRHLPNAYATDKDMMQYKLLPFVGCKIAFIGYQSDEEQHMADISIKNGGEVVDPSNPSCTHFVVEDGSPIVPECRQNVYVVKNEWFWACIQMEAKADENIYIFENPNIVSSSSRIVPVRGNKRKRLESVAHQLAMESLQEVEYYGCSSDLRKKSDVAKLSISGSFLDGTLSPDKSLDISADGKDLDHTFIKSPPLDMRVLSPRQQVCFELFQTENNYVGILHTIMTVFKEPLEKTDQVGGPLLAPAEIKIIFGNLPPIYEIHQKIRNELACIIHCWNEDQSVGNLILNHAHEFMKSYPPFVNFFEKTKEVLSNCDSTKPRFHAFLKRCQSKPECGRQTLQELLIRPVQRLPSVILLLSDILKRTSKTNSDYEALEKAILALKDVMMHINEDKRKTEGQVAMFDIVNDIENCPPNLLSSHRNLVSKTDMQEVTDLLNKKGGTITMFLFTDVLEICKKRSKASNSLKSPGVVSLASGTLKAQTKSFKHLELIPLSHIKRVVDITEAEDFRNVFAIVAWSPKELKELLYAFIILEDMCKNAFLRTLCRQIANSVCKADTENLLTSLDPQSLALQSSESTGNMLTKALTKTRDKLGRALSMRRTPTKRGLSRAVSTIISPLRNFGTPTHNMPALKLSSVTNLSQVHLIPEALLSLQGHLFKDFRSKSVYQTRSRSLIRPLPALPPPQLLEKN